jgi:hypothetical protein
MSILDTFRDAVDGFKLDVFVEKYKEKIAEGLKEILVGYGEEKIHFLVDSNISLWANWPEKEKIVNGAQEYRDYIGDLNLFEVADELASMISETLPQFSFIPKPWIVKTLRGMRVDIMSHAVV